MGELKTIGPPLSCVSREADRLLFAERGHAGAVVPGVVSGVLAWALWALELPAVTLVLPAGLSLLLIAGGVSSWALATDVELDVARGRYRVRQGNRWLPASVTGTLLDFAAVVRDHDGHASWQVCLQPRGSGRGYCLYQFPGSEREAARRAADDLAALLRLPVEHRELGEPQSRDLRASEVDPLRPPEGCIQAVLDAGRCTLLIPWWGPWSEIVRIEDSGIEFGVRLQLPLGRRSDSLRRAEWSEISELGVETARSTRNLGTRWRLIRDWRARAAEHWTWRCAERKRQPSAPPPGWAAWFVVTQFPFETRKALTVRFWRRPAVQIGDSDRLCAAELEWLRAVVDSAWRRRG